MIRAIEQVIGGVFLLPSLALSLSLSLSLTHSCGLMNV